MKSSQITLIVIGFILLALMATNPSIEDHREGVKKIYKGKLAQLNKDKKDDPAAQIGTGIGMLIGDGFIDKIVSSENFLLFSLTKISVSNETKNIGIGILGKVWIDYDLDDDVSVVSDNSNNTNNSNSIPNIENTNEDNSPIHMEIFDKKTITNSMVFKKSTISSNTFMYHFETGIEDEGFLYLYNDKSDNLFRFYVSNFDPIRFEIEHKFNLFEWKYNLDKTECQSINYEISLKYFDTKPVFDYIISSKGPCAG